MINTKKHELRLSFYLEAFVDIYRHATETLLNLTHDLSATEFVLVENCRQTALYEIATLLKIPDLPPPGERLSGEQWEQCLDFIRDQESEQPVCLTCNGTGMRHTYYGGDGWSYERCHCCNGGV